jgi:large subunit ribosomal protein L6
MSIANGNADSCPQSAQASFSSQLQKESRLIRKLYQKDREVGYLATSIEKKKIDGIEVPSEITFKLDGSLLVVKGPLGECRKDFAKTPVQLIYEDGRLIVKAYRSRKKDSAIANTVTSIINNMIKGVTKGFTYRLKVVFAHFPVSVRVKDNDVHIENFYGERSPRKAKIVGDCEVLTEGDDIIVKGVSKEDVGQTAANIEQTTSVKRKDQRVFLDGIYVYEKAN